jgi:hypothetical protein
VAKAARTVAAKPSLPEVIMPIGAIIAIVIVGVLVVAAAVAAGTVVARRQALRRRVEQLDIRPLSGEERVRYDSQWIAAQGRFVDDPPGAARAAAALVIALAGDRGYSAGDDEELLTELSVRHADELTGYRQARETTGRIPAAATEELRQAMIGYRAMFRQLLRAPESPDETGIAADADSETDHRAVVDATKE